MLMGTCRERNWSDLPFDILSNVLRKLTIVDDYIRFGSVSISWRTVFLQQKQNPNFQPLLLIPSPTRKQVPNPYPRGMKPKRFLLIPSTTRKHVPNPYSRGIKRKRRDEEEEAQRCLYNLATKKLYNIQVQIRRKRYCRGSSFGWLITMKCKKYETEKFRCYVRLLNPLLPKQDIIHLPSLPLVDGLSFPFIYLRKAVLSAPPDNNHNKNFVVVAIVGEGANLAYFNPAEKTTFCWIPIGDWNEPTHYADLIYFNKMKEFYAVNSETGEVYAIDVKKQVHEFKKVAPLIQEYRGFFRYIVESPEGELLQVLKEEDQIMEGDVKFEVFKLHPRRREWIQMHSLEDMILFLGTNSSISRYASDFPECKANCIYFTNNRDIDFYNPCIVYEPEDMGIYNFHDGTIQPYFSNVSRVPRESTPIWLEPTLRR